MDSRPAGAAVLFASGVASCAAWDAGLYANALLAALVGVWIGGALIWRVRGVVVARTQRPALPVDGERQRLRAILDQVPVALTTVAADGVPRAINRAARALFGTDDRIADAALREALARPSGGRLALGRPARMFAMSVASVASSGGVIRLAALTDVEAELRAAEAAALRELMQVVSHEVMNSLTPIASLAETADELLASGCVAPAREAVETIGRRARGLDGFVTGYRALARLPPPTLRPVSVTSLLGDVARLFETVWRPRGVTLTVMMPVPDIVAPLDAGLVGQALSNLLTNGAEAALAADRARWVALSAWAADGRVALRVEDGGNGVSAERRETIFAPFVTSKPGGSGIGLGLARQIALSHGGSLVLEAGDAGATFVMLL